jgi:hypothetical protein
MAKRKSAFTAEEFQVAAKFGSKIESPSHRESVAGRLVSKSA